MGRINISSSKKVCEIDTDISELEKLLTSKEAREFVDKKIPGGRIDTYLSNSRDIRLGVYRSNDYRIRENYPNFEVFCPEVNYRDVLALSDYLLERVRQEEGIYNLHSSTVGKGDLCIVIYGASKSGKTVISIEASQNHGLDFLTNERTLIDLEAKKIVGGCSLLDIAPYHWKAFPKLNGKTELRLEKLGDKRPIIKGIVYPSIDSGQTEIIVDQKDLVGTEWLLYPEFTSRIRGVNKRMFNFSYPLDSLDTKDLARKRMRDLCRFVKKVPFYFVRGKKEAISEFIKDQL